MDGKGGGLWAVIACAFGRGTDGKPTTSGHASCFKRQHLPTATALSLAVFLGLLAGRSEEAHAEAMVLPGSLDVTSNGAATYSIPIAVLPGTAGMAPSLSLDYSSQSGSGLEGVGWSLSGLPSIGRCARTMAQDSVRGAVNYDANDRFCMEGQRLVVISGTYGADGSEYRTEIEGFSKILAHGVAGTGPAWFEVHTKAGQIMEFGHTADSQFLAQGKTTARAWGIDKISDTKGNYLTVAYQNDATNGQAYPTRIDYTGNAAAGLSPYNSVQFVYETRPDIVPMYHAGSLMQTMVRLTDIKTYTGTTLADDYKLTYETQIATTVPNPYAAYLAYYQGGTARSRLISVQLCAAGGSCLPATSLASTLGSTGGYMGSSMAVFAAQMPPNQYSPYTGDFNGDGKTDIFWCKQDSSFRCASGTTTYTWLSNGDGTFAQSSNGAVPYLADAVIPVDFNGDGKTDLYFCNLDGSSRCTNNAAYLWKSNGDGTFTSSTVTSPPGNSGVFAADFNGDGRTDLFFCAKDTNGRCNGSTTYVWLSNGDGTFNAVTGSALPTGNLSASLGDFNGDGFTDIFFCVSNTSRLCTGASYLLTATGSGTFTTTTIGATPANVPILGDLNGDGLTDIFWCSANSKWQCSTPTFYTWVSKGNGAFVANTLTDGVMLINPFTGLPVGGGTYAAMSLDMNADGRADMVFCAVDANGQCVANTGLFVWPSPGIVSPNEGIGGAAPSASDNLAPISGDFNGDGFPDFYFCARDNASRCVTTVTPQFVYSALITIQLPYSVTVTRPTPPDMLASFTTGSGLTTALTYAPLTDVTVYTKDVTSVYPTIDVVAPFYVVSRIDAPSGTGGVYSSTYAYAGAKSDLNGRSFLGFRQRTVTDPQTGVVQTTNYNQTFPMIGLVASETKALGAQTLNSTVNTYTPANLGGTRNFVPLTQSVVSSWDLDGSAIPAVTTGYQYDAYGNATQVTISTPDGASKTTTNTYTNDTTNWFLGRLTGTSVTSTVP